MEKKPLIQITGTVETLVYSNEDTGFSVLELNKDGQLLTVVGEMIGIAAGERLTLHGVYSSHPNYGLQFKATAYERTLPATAVAIEKYLAAGAVKGIGPVLASRLVEFFGDQTLQVMEKEPERLLRVKGVTPAKFEKIIEEFNRMFGIRTTMMFLSQFGIDSSAAISIWKRWGNHSQKMIEENPYLLCEEDFAMDFERCDEIARKLNVPLDSSYRIAAALLFVLRHNLLNGHTCLPCDKLVPNISALISQNTIMVEKELEHLEEEKQVSMLTVQGRVYCYIPDYLEAERYIASRVELMLLVQETKTNDYTAQIAKLEEDNGLLYASLQKEAIQQSLNQPIFILTGGPGTGKTTTINAILELFDNIKKKVALCAPTGRAAKRMSEVTGREAKTIHRLLEVDFSTGQALSFKRNEKNPLPCDVLIVDEMSMVDVPLMRSLICAIKMSCRLILVGDSDQLPSVGPGNVLKDLIDSDRIPKVRLTEIFRQAQKSLIVTNAHAIVRGEVPDLSKRDNDFFFLKREGYEQMKGTVIDLCSTRLPKTYGYSPQNDIQVIAPTRVGPVGTNNLNAELQQVLNPPSPQKDEHRYFGRLLRTGDKVMQVKNNYDITWKKDSGEEGMGVYNGDIGRVEMIDKPSKTILIRFDDHVASYIFEMADQIELAYAITVHKSQGSEFEAVIIPLMHYKSKMHYRNLLYTAVTRARNRLVILGCQKTIADMVANDRRTIRYTNLLDILRGDC